MVIMAVVEWYNMATNMVFIGVYGKSRKNADHPLKRNWNKPVKHGWCDSLIGLNIKAIMAKLAIMALKVSMAKCIQRW